MESHWTGTITVLPTCTADFCRVPTFKYDMVHGKALHLARTGTFNGPTSVGCRRCAAQGRQHGMLACHSRVHWPAASLILWAGCWYGRLECWVVPGQRGGSLLCCIVGSESCHCQRSRGKGREHCQSPPLLHLLLKGAV